MDDRITVERFLAAVDAPACPLVQPFGWAEFDEEGKPCSVCAVTAVALMEGLATAAELLQAVRRDRAVDILAERLSLPRAYMLGLADGYDASFGAAPHRGSTFGERADGYQDGLACGRAQLERARRAVGLS
jgi:hypothetical protein